MKVNKLLLCIILSLSVTNFAATSAFAADDVLYKTYEQKLEAGDLNGAYEALNERSKADPDNFEYAKDEIAFILNFSSDKSEAIPLIEQGLEKAESKKDEQWLPRFNELYAGTLYMLGDNQNSYARCQKALSYYVGKDGDEELSNIYKLMIVVCDGLGKNDEALNYGLKTVDLKRKLFGNESEDVASALSTLSVAYLRLNDLEKATEAINESEEIYKKLGVEDPSFYQNKATIAATKKDYVEARELYSKALEIARKENQIDRVIQNLKSLSNVAYSQEKADDAISYMDEAVETIASTYGESSPAYASILRAKGVLERDLGKYEEAMSILGKALKMFDDTDGMRSIESQQTLLEMYRCACLIASNDVEKLRPMAKAFISDKYFLLEQEGKNPVYLLTFGDWGMNHAGSIFDYIPEVINNDVEVTYSADGKEVTRTTSLALGEFKLSMQRDKKLHEELSKIAE